MQTVLKILLICMLCVGVITGIVYLIDALAS